MSSKKKLAPAVRAPAVRAPAVFLRPLTFTVFFLMIFPLIYALTAVGLETVTLSDTRQKVTITYETMIFAVWQARMVPAIWTMFCCILAGWLGAAGFYAKAKICSIDPEKPALRVWGSLAAIAVPAVGIVLGAVLTYRLEVYWLAGIVGAIFCAAMGCRNIQKSYGEILTRYVLMASAGVTAAGILILYGLKSPYSSSLLIWNFFIQAAVCAVSQNQGNLDYLMLRRKHDLSHLPRKVRFYSLMLIAGIMLLVLAAILFRPQLTVLFRLLLSGLKYLLRWIILAILWLLSLSSGSEEPEPDGAGGAGGGMLDGLPPGTSSPWWDYIFGTVMVLLILFLLIYYRSSILSALKNFWRRIKEGLRQLFMKAPALQRLVQGEQSEYYADQVEELSPESLLENEEKVFRLRDWKREVRRFAAKPPSAEKYREGYRLGLLWLRWRGAELQPSDTPQEILAKAKPALSQSDWEAVTDFYQLVRYREDETASPEALTALTETLRKMATR